MHKYAVDWNLNFGSYKSYFILTAKREESRKAQVLFVIVIIFVVCNVPRIILNMEELSAIAPSYWNSYNPISKENSSEQAFKTFDAIKCYSAPFWAHILRSISKLLLTLNASVGCFVYCMICSRFRNEMSKGFTKIKFYMKKIIGGNWCQIILLNVRYNW